MTASPRPPERPQGLERRQYEVLEAVVPSTTCPLCGDVIFAGDFQDPATGRCVDCVGRGGSVAGWIAVGIVVLIAAIAIAWLGWRAAPREADTSTAPRPGASVVDVASGGAPAAQVPASASGSPLPGAPRPSERPAIHGGGDPPQPAGAPAPREGQTAPNVGTIDPQLITTEQPSPTQDPQLAEPTTGTIEPLEETAPRYRGTATWYCLSGSSACTVGYDQDDRVAAIDSDLGFAKGDVVLVRYTCGEGCRRSVEVEIVDVCECPGERLIDLTSGAFQELAPLGLGVIPVTVEIAVNAGLTLPPTDVAP